MDERRERQRLLAVLGGLALLVIVGGGAILYVAWWLPQQAASPLTGVELGAVVMAGSIEEGTQAPLDVRNTFPPDAPVLFVVAEVRRIDQGTSVFVRWSRDGQPFEDADTLTAHQPYQNVFLAFRLERVTDQPLEPGPYSAQFFFNGSAGPSVEFAIQE